MIPDFLSGATTLGGLGVDLATNFEELFLAVSGVLDTTMGDTLRFELWGNVPVKNIKLWEGFNIRQ